MWVLYQVAMNFQEVFSNFSVLPGQMLQQLEQNAPETRSGIARRRGLLIRNAQRRIILRDDRRSHTIFVLSSPLIRRGNHLNHCRTFGFRSLCAAGSQCGQTRRKDNPCNQC